MKRVYLIISAIKTLFVSLLCRKAI